MHQQPSRTAGDTKGPTIYSKHTCRSQDGHSIHGQLNYTGLPQKQRNTHSSRRKHKASVDGVEENANLVIDINRAPP